MRAALEGRRDQRPRVILLRIGEDLLGRPLLHHPPPPQHDDAMGERTHDAQIMADEEISEAVIRLQPAQQIDDLRLHGPVERAGRFIQHDETRLQHHGARNGDALPLPAARIHADSAPAHSAAARPPRSTATTLACRSAPRQLRKCTFSPSATISSTVMRGERLP